MESTVNVHGVAMTMKRQYTEHWFPLQMSVEEAVQADGGGALRVGGRPLQVDQEGLGMTNNAHLCRGRVT